MKLLLILFVITYSTSALAQKNNLNLVLININKDQVIKPTYKGWLKFYKDYISSQDGEVCMFYPSCSHFAQKSFKKYSFFQAIFLTTDRLTRCNGRPGKYFQNIQDKYIDLP